MISHNLPPLLLQPDVIRLTDDEAAASQKGKHHQITFGHEISLDMRQLNILHSQREDV